MTTRLGRLAGLAGLATLIACAPNAATAPPPPGSGPATTSVPPGAGAPGGGTMVIVGRIETMDDPPVAEAMFIEDGVVAAVGSRDEVLAQAGDQVPVIDIGHNVAYPGFIDSHAHWIGDRDYYGLDSAAEAVDAAASRGWTSVSEQWVNPERLDELTRLAADRALPLRLDAYLALNFEKEFLGDWYVGREPGFVNDRLRVQGLKIHLDHGLGGAINWERADLVDAIDRANDAGWQVSVHSARSEAMDLVLDAFEAALGATGPNPLHHRIEHAVQVTDEQLARMVAMDIVTVTHLDGAADWVLDDAFRAELEKDVPGARIDWVARWRDLVDAGLHVASATDAPWTFPDFELTADMGRPVDQIAAGMDGRVRTSPKTPAWLRDQLLTSEQGLRAVTLDAAYALGDDGRRGRLAAGLLGDVTILSGDVTAATPDEIRDMTIVATIVGGVAAYCADPAICSSLER